MGARLGRPVRRACWSKESVKVLRSSVTLHVTDTLPGHARDAT